MKKDLPLAAEEKIGEAGYVWSINANLGDGKMLQVTGNFIKGASTRDMSDEIDRIAKVFQIQRIKQLEIPVMERELRAQAEAGDKYSDDLDRMIELNRDKIKLNSNEKAQMDNIRENVRLIGDNLERGKKRMDELVQQLKDLESE
jgi:hypothetical protein